MRSWRNRWPNAVLVALGLLYPFLVYVGLLKFSPGFVVAGALVFIALRVLVSDKSAGGRLVRIISLAAAGAVVVAVVTIDSELALKLYPITVSLGFAVAFGYSLIRPPSIVERIARLTILEFTTQAQRYASSVTAVWLIFFLVNAAISGWTALSASRETWVLYNGLISYGLIAALFGCELVARRLFMERQA
jgi:uncharacterized membrane protein